MEQREGKVVERWSEKGEGREQLELVGVGSLKTGLVDEVFCEVAVTMEDMTDCY